MKLTNRQIKVDLTRKMHNMPKYKVKVPFFTSGRYLARNSKVEFTEEFASKVKLQLGEDSLVLIHSKQLKAEVKKNPKGAIKNSPTTKK